MALLFNYPFSGRRTYPGLPLPPAVSAASIRAPSLGSVSTVILRRAHRRRRCRDGRSGASVLSVFAGWPGHPGAKAQMDCSPGPSRPSSLRHRSWDFAGSCDDGELDGCSGDANLERAAAKPSPLRSCINGLNLGAVTRFGGGGGVDVGGEEASLTRGLG